MMENNTASVSVVIPCYCCKETINRALDSVLGQTLSPREIILIEDKSPDDTADFLRTLVKQRENDLVDIRLICLEQNGGPAVARNTGWDCATTDYVAFLDSDDCWHKRKIEIQYGWMLENKSAVLSCNKNVVVEEFKNLDLCSSVDRFFPSEVSFQRMLYSNPFATSGVMVKRMINLRFDSKLKYAEDFLLWALICFYNRNCYLLNDKGLSFRFDSPFGGKGLSGNLKGMYSGKLKGLLRLRREGCLSLVSLLKFQLYESIKFLRRLVLSKMK